MPQPKSRKIAILGYRSVGEYRTRLNAGKKKKKKSHGGGEVGDECPRPLGTVDLEAFAPPINNRLR